MGGVAKSGECWSIDDLTAARNLAVSASYQPPLGIILNFAVTTTL